MRGWEERALRAYWALTVLMSTLTFSDPWSTVDFWELLQLPNHCLSEARSAYGLSDEVSAGHTGLGHFEVEPSRESGNWPGWTLMLVTDTSDGFLLWKQEQSQLWILEPISTVFYTKFSISKSCFTCEKQENS